MSNEENRRQPDMHDSCNRYHASTRQTDRDLSGSFARGHGIETRYSSVWSRLQHMLLGWGTVGVVYTLSGVFQGQGVVLPETALDRLIPFNPVGIWIYLSFFLLIPYAYLTASTGRLLWLQRSMQTCAVLCGLIFFIYPTTLHYPAITGDGFSQTLLALLLSADSSQNCLPSLHAALTLLSVWALLDARRPWRSALAVLCGAAICISIIQLRRHVSIDLSAGLAAGIACGWFCMRYRDNKESSS